MPLIQWHDEGIKPATGKLLFIKIDYVGPIKRK
jgi:hypothetical protein